MLSSIASSLAAGRMEIAVNLEEIFTTGDCSKDVPLEWGDVVQIPQLHHLLNEAPGWLADIDREVLLRCCITNPSGIL